MGRLGLILFGVLMPGMAFASSFPCHAELLDLAVVMLALPAALVACGIAWIASFRQTLTMLAVCGGATGALILMIPCSQGKDADAMALAALFASMLAPAGLALWRRRRASEDT